MSLHISRSRNYDRAKQHQVTNNDETNQYNASSIYLGSIAHQLFTKCVSAHAPSEGIAKK